MKGLVWVNRNPDAKPGELEAEAAYGLPSFMGRPSHIIYIKVPWYIRLLPFWGRWKNIAIDMKAVYEANQDVWPPREPGKCRGL